MASPIRRTVSARIEQGRELLDRAQRLPAGKLSRLARPIEVFSTAQHAYAAAAADVYRLQRELRSLSESLDLETAAELDAAANDARSSVGDRLGHGVAVSQAAVRALERAEQIGREDEAYWLPLSRLSAQCDAARAKRRSLVGIWEAAFQRLSSLLAENMSYPAAAKAQGHPTVKTARGSSTTKPGEHDGNDDKLSTRERPRTRRDEE